MQASVTIHIPKETAKPIDVAHCGKPETYKIRRTALHVRDPCQ